MRKIIIGLLVLSGLSTGHGGMPVMELISETTTNGRKIVRYEHASLPEWGYEKPQRDYFYIVHPKTPPTGPAALQVILHSAGGGGESEMFEQLKRPNNLIGLPADSNYGLHLDCRAHQATDWWWGFHRLEKNAARYKDEPGPTERRLLATVDWVMRNLPVDTNRIYLSGGSMGGSGSLGLGLGHGDIFAAIAVLVPAGVGHAQFRMNGKHADPPPVVNFSSQTDPWAAGQEQFIAACQSNRYSQVFAWGPFGHGGPLHGYHPAATAFPWLELRKNEAYPVFTGTSTDNKYPGLNNTNAIDQVGQINAYFRWKNITDTPQRFAMELRLVKKSELVKPVEIQAASVADVTLRRVQQFRVKPGQMCKWQMGAGPAGQVRADAEGLMTIPRVTITETPVTLTVSFD